MPQKPTTWGLKALVVADCVTGYECNWKLYTGIKTKKVILYFFVDFQSNARCIVVHDKFFIFYLLIYLLIF